MGESVVDTPIRKLIPSANFTLIDRYTVLQYILWSSTKIVFEVQKVQGDSLFSYYLIHYDMT